MTDAEILDAVRAVAREHLQFTGPIDADTLLVETLRLDSLRRITLVAEMENRLSICFERGDEAGLVTVGDLVALARRRLP
jgi:acyl carrier protein